MATQKRFIAKNGLDNNNNSITNVTTLTATGIISGSELTSSLSSGDEGGQINLAQPQTNTTMGGGVTIDVYQNKLRFFEQGGSARGVYIDLTTASGGVGTNLLGGTGNVSSVSIVSANGFAGTVATSTTTPAITLSTSITGILKGNGTAISAATAGTDYASPSQTMYIGTTSVAINRATANLALTGISSVTLPGSTSGTVQLIPTAAVGTGTILTIPATTGTIITTGDSATVTNTMLAGSIAITKLVSSTISGVSLGSSLNELTISSPLVGTSYNGSTAVTLSIPAATTSVSGYLTSTDWNTFNGKGSGSVTSVGFTGGIISVATATTTPALTVVGTSGGIPYFSSASTWATSAALAASSLVIGGGAGVAPSTITTGTGVTTALGVAVGSAGAFVTFNGALGTPSSGTVTNLTGTASININGTVGATTATTGAFTTVSASGQITSTIAIGTAPFVVTSTTPVTNLSIGGNAGTVTTVTQTNIAGAVTPSISGNVLTSNGTAWISSAPSGVSSVNTRTGAVTLTSADVGLGNVTNNAAVANLSGTNTGDQVIPVASSTTPAALGSAAVGTGTTFARADHVHASPTTITGNAGTATSIAAGVAGSIPYQSAASTTAMTAASTVNGQVLTTVTAGGAPTWVSPTVGTVTSVTGTAPVVSSGGTTPAISMAAATASVNGYMTSTYATKLDGISAGATTNTGTVTSVAALTLGTTGTDVSSTVATGTTTPVITLNIPTASATNRGVLSSTDWGIFNGKQAAGAYLTSAVTSVGGTGTVSGLTLTGTVTSTGSLTLGGTLALGSLNTLGTAAGLSATLIVGSGGTGVTTLTGIPYGNGTSAFTVATAAQLVTAIGASTTLVAGSMSSADKTKLDAITGTNTGNETGTTIRAALGITTLSGSNTGDQTSVSGSSGSCTGNAATSTNASAVNGTSGQMNGDGWWRSTGATGWYSTTYAVGIYSTAVNSVSTYGTTVSFTASGNITAYSDLRLKENIVTVDNALDKVMQLRGVYYNRIEDKTQKRKVGVIAQEIQKVLPEVVLEDNDMNKTLSVDYGNIVALLIEAIKEQQSQIDSLLESRQ